MKIQIPPGVMSSDYRRLDPNAPLSGWEDVQAIVMRWTWRNSPYPAMATLAEYDEPVERAALDADIAAILGLGGYGVDIPTRLKEDLMLVRRLQTFLDGVGS